MPSPPRKNESKSEFIGRCVKYIMNREGKTQEQALGMCYSLYNQARKKKRKKK